MQDDDDRVRLRSLRGHGAASRTRARSLCERVRGLASTVTNWAWAPSAGDVRLDVRLGRPTCCARGHRPGQPALPRLAAERPTAGDAQPLRWARRRRAPQYFTDGDVYARIQPERTCRSILTGLGETVVDQTEADERRQWVIRILELQRHLVRRWEHDARTMSWPSQLAGGLVDVQALRSLDREENLSAGELARRLRMSESAITGVLNRLESRGLVARERRARDRRVVRIVMTAAGREALREADQLLMEQAANQVRNLSLADLAVMHDLLVKMSQDGPEPLDI